jgi:hypothetical protein
MGLGLPAPRRQFPGTTAELYEGIESLTDDQQQHIAGGNAVTLYSL